MAETEIKFRCHSSTSWGAFSVVEPSDVGGVVGCGEIGGRRLVDCETMAYESSISREELVRVAITGCLRWFGSMMLKVNL